MKKVRVAVNGYGVIGKRVADAVALQEDMELVGIGDVSADYRLRLAEGKGLPIFAPGPDERAKLEEAGFVIAGLLPELLDAADVVVDCTPKKVGALYAEIYRERGVKFIFQGGEKHALTGHSFVAEANYETALGRTSTRVVSCNTTAPPRSQRRTGPSACSRTSTSRSVRRQGAGQVPTRADLLLLRYGCCSEIRMNANRLRLAVCFNKEVLPCHTT